MHSLAHRRCPACGCRIEATRFWLRAHIWARWPCRFCGTPLTFNKYRRMLATVLMLSTSAALYLMLRQIGVQPRGWLVRACVAVGCVGPAMLWLYLDGVVRADRREDFPVSDTKRPAPKTR